MHGLLKRRDFLLIVPYSLSAKDFLYLVTNRVLLPEVRANVNTANEGWEIKNVKEKIRYLLATV